MVPLITSLVSKGSEVGAVQGRPRRRASEMNSMQIVMDSYSGKTQETTFIKKPRTQRSLIKEHCLHNGGPEAHCISIKTSHPSFCPLPLVHL